MTKELNEMTDSQKRVFMLLPIGLDKLISKQEIEDILELDERTIMGIIEILILKYNIPIGSFRNSDNFGYFIATNEKEKDIGTYSLTQQINTMKKRAERVKNADLNTAILYIEKYKDEAADYEGQSTIYEFLKIADEQQDEADEDSTQLQGLG